ncbi:MAG: hypothetical protein ABI266_06550 [Ginsengibacter sp.]
MIKSIIVAAFCFTTLLGQAQIKKVVSSKMTNPEIMVTFKPGTVGEYFQKNRNIYNKLSEVDKKQLGTQANMRLVDWKSMPKQMVTNNLCEICPVCCDHQLLLKCVPKDQSSIANTNFEGKPCGIAISKTGRVAVSEFRGDATISVVKIWNTIAGFDGKKIPDQTLESIWSPEAICFTPDEKLVITESTGNEIGIIVFAPNANGKYQRKSFGNFRFINPQGFYNNPRGVCAIDNNTVLLTNDGQGTLEQVNIISGATSIIKISNLQSPKAVALNADIIAIAEFNGGKVSIYDRSFKLLKSVDVNGHPIDLAIGNDNIYVTTFTSDYSSSTIKVISLSNNQLTATTYKPSDGFSNNSNGENYSAPFGIAFPKGKCDMYVADGGKNRVLKF